MLNRVGSGLLISSKTIVFEVMDTINCFYDKLQYTHTIRYRAEISTTVRGVTNCRLF